MGDWPIGGGAPEGCTLHFNLDPSVLLAGRALYGPRTDAPRPKRGSLRIFLDPRALLPKQKRKEKRYTVFYLCGDFSLRDEEEDRKKLRFNFDSLILAINETKVIKVVIAKRTINRVSSNYPNRGCFIHKDP